MATNFPGSQDDGTTLPDASPTGFTNSPSLSTVQNNQNAAIKALEAKLGISLSTPTAGMLLVGTGAGSSTWSKAAPTGAIVGTTDAQSLSNKTITASTISGTSLSNVSISSDAITGFTTTNTGTIFGVPFTAGVIQNANTVDGAALKALTVGSGALSNNIVTPDKMNGALFPKFYAYSNTLVSLTVSTATKLVLPNILFDTLSNFSTVNSRFTAPYSGYYVLSGFSSYNGTVQTRGFASLYKNGAEIVRGVDTKGTISYGSAVYGFLFLNAGDYIELFQYVDGACTTNSPGTLTGLSGYLYSKL